MRIETAAGIRLAEMTIENDLVTAVRVDMGEPLFEKKDIPMKGEGICRLETIEALGREFYLLRSEHRRAAHGGVWRSDGGGHTSNTAPRWKGIRFSPAKVNVNFINVEPDGSISVRTWERGCGRTLACGTGSCAAAVCASMAGFTGRRVKVHLALGELFDRMGGKRAYLYDRPRRRDI